MTLRPVAKCGWKLNPAFTRQCGRSRPSVPCSPDSTGNATTVCATGGNGLDCAVHLISKGQKRRRLGGARVWPWLGVLLCVAYGWELRGADLKDAQALFLSGDYPECIKTAEEMVRHRPASEEWEVLLSKALLASGKYPEAYKAMTNALEENAWSIRLQWQAREVFLRNGFTEAAGEITDRIVERVNAQPASYREAESLLVFGQAALLKGADPKLVLDTLFDPARKSDPSLRDGYLVSAGLALEKHDFALAAKRFEEGLKQLPADPDLLCGLAHAYAPSDAALAADSVGKALQRNSNHVGSLLLLVDRSIDGEDYTEAGQLLDRIQSVSQWEPDAWAYRAVVAHLQHQPDLEDNARLSAMKYWTNNPRVDHLIGEKLSQNYRFTEGASHQRQALRFDPEYLPAKAQLAQDLLRLGEESEGWNLADEVQKKDGYDVEIFNLTTLHDTMAKFATLTNQDFVVRMGPHEAAVYGGQVLDLLERARSNLCAKYGFEVKRPTIVEVFPEQKDFAVRTFGMPGNPGYLGVCFGSLVTANSPATHPGHPVNWNSVLYHEFCHVVTLQMTHNKMPRWLSEGISVYEEAQANPSWGQRMDPRYREMVMGGELTPISKLSAAFLAPPSPIHLQFAYYESSLVVEFLVQKFGLDQLKAILLDLGTGTEINHAVEAHTAPLDQLEQDFGVFVHQRTEQLAPGLDWEKPKLEDLPSGKSANPLLSIIPDGSDSQSSREVEQKEAPSKAASDETNVVSSGAGSGGLGAWVAKHPTNYYSLMEQAKELLAKKDYESAKTPLKKLVELYPTQTGSESAYAMLAAAHRALGETNAERQVLARFAQEDDEAKEAYLRLADLGVAARDWPAVVENVRRCLAVDPLSATPYQMLAQASKHTGDSSQSIQANRALLQLDPPNPSEVHFELAQALHRSGDPAAKRHVLEALEEAPRYRAALRLLLEMNEEPRQSKEGPRADNATQ
jgi:tetratricopeptide (TPR) repeat protein